MQDAQELESSILAQVDAKLALLEGHMQGHATQLDKRLQDHATATTSLETQVRHMATTVQAGRSDSVPVGDA